MGRGALRCITGRKGTPLLCCSSLKAIVTHLHLVQISDCKHTEASSSTIRNRDTTMISKYKLVRSLHWPVIVMEANVRQCQPALICIKAIDTLWEGGHWSQESARSRIIRKDLVVDLNLFAPMHFNFIVGEWQVATWLQKVMS